MGDTDGGGKGCPLFEGIDVVDDYLPRFNRHLDQHCDHGTETMAAIDKAKVDPKDEMILCPSFFDRGTFGGGPGRHWPTVYTPTCDNIGNRLSTRMETSATTLLHEYTHLITVVGSVLHRCTKDYDDGEGFYNSRKLDKALSKTNADSYPSFATELMWSKLCSRDFEPPQ
jgi:hypothetical protein